MACSGLYLTVLYGWQIKTLRFTIARRAAAWAGLFVFSQSQPLYDLVPEVQFKICRCCSPCSSSRTPCTNLESVWLQVLHVLALLAIYAALGVLSYEQPSTSSPRQPSQGSISQPLLGPRQPDGASVADQETSGTGNAELPAALDCGWLGATASRGGASGPMPERDVIQLAQLAGRVKTGPLRDSTAESPRAAGQGPPTFFLATRLDLEPPSVLRRPEQPLSLLPLVHKCLLAHACFSTRC